MNINPDKEFKGMIHGLIWSIGILILFLFMIVFLGVNVPGIKTTKDVQTDLIESAQRKSIDVPR